VQRGQFKRLGVMGEWSHPYTTMNYLAEATIAGELHKFVANGLLYRGFRPVMWSPVEKTALADAEIEYYEKTSPTIYVKFPGRFRPRRIAWCFHRHLDYHAMDHPGQSRHLLFGDDGLFRLRSGGGGEGALGTVGEKILLADVLADQTATHAKIKLTRLGAVDPSALVCAHPFRGKGYDFEVPLLAGEHVTADTGTGFVHTAPGHGEDDFDIVLEKLGKDYPAKNPDAFASSPPKAVLRRTFRSSPANSSCRATAKKRATPTVPSSRNSSLTVSS